MGRGSPTDSQTELRRISKTYIVERLSLTVTVSDSESTRREEKRRGEEKRSLRAEEEEKRGEDSERSCQERRGVGAELTV